jgi:predicted helicase
MSSRPQFETAEDKLAFLGSTNISSLQFEDIQPDAKNYWINIADNDFDTLMPSASKETKLSRSTSQERAIFKLYTLGVVTARDDWVYDFDRETLGQKVRYLIKTYNADLERVGGKGSKRDVSSELDNAIKWTRAVKRDLGNGISYKFVAKKIVRASYRPFVSEWLYRDNHLNEMPYQTPLLFGDGSIRNPAITVMGDSTGKPYFCLAIDTIPDFNFVSPASGGTQTLALHRVDSSGNKIENITNWALEQFAIKYNAAKTSKRPITKNAIFQYVYGILHDPIYRDKYALNLKREFPRLPFYAEFWRWAEWGEKLMALHIGYETVEPWPLQRIDVPDEKSRKAGLPPKAMLRANTDAGNIQLDSETQLTGMPPQAWTYRLGNRSALEWILDQYKEKTPKDRTIREKFYTYRFADHKEKVIDLLKRVTRVSVETMKVVEAMGQLDRSK